MTVHKELNAANNHVSLETNLTPAEFSDENAALDNPLTAVLQSTQVSSAWTLHAHKLWENKCVVLSHYVSGNIVTQWQII